MPPKAGFGDQSVSVLRDRDPVAAIMDGIMTLDSPAGRDLLLSESFARLEAAALALSEAAGSGGPAIAAIGARGDRIDRLQSDNRARLDALVGSEPG